MTTLESNTALAREYLARIAAGDAQGVADMFTDDGVIIVESNTLLPPEIRGRDHIQATIASVVDKFPETGLRIIADQTTAEDDRVAIVAHSEAVHASGRAYRNRFHFLLYFKDGKIAASHEYLDSLHLTEVFFEGARPSPT